MYLLARHKVNHLLAIMPGLIIAPDATDVFWLL